MKTSYRIYFYLLLIVYLAVQECSAIRNLDIFNENESEGKVLRKRDDDDGGDKESKPIGDPTEEPPEGDPTEEPPEGDPTEQPPEGDPTEEPPEGDPTEEPPEGDPTEKPPEGDPTEEPPEGDPTEEPPEGDATEIPPENTENPSIDDATEQPPEDITTEIPPEDPENPSIDDATKQPPEGPIGPDQSQPIEDGDGDRDPSERINNSAPSPINALKGREGENLTGKKCLEKGLCTASFQCCSHFCDIHNKCNKKPNK